MEDAAWATLTAVLVSASLPFYLYGAWYILDRDPVTWPVLTHHLLAVGIGLVLTTGPVLFWMLPRLFDQLRGLAVLHAFFGLQAYAFLTFALTGIVRIFQVKVAHDLYADPTGGATSPGDHDGGGDGAGPEDEPVSIDEFHEKMPDWRRRLRVGVAGYVLCWLVAWLIGLARFVELYQFWLF